MGKLALYRKYRSSDFDELLGQQHVSSTLGNALKQGNISHAYLFTGPRGIGKTSAARILAARANGLKKGEESIDIIEIDAASNNGVDEIRDLREKVHIAPNYHRYKVYIVDEVHMLSQAAFNALLKTLEEPPSHVIFILATTEPHKLPATIISRTQHFAFRPVTKDTIAGHIKTIAGRESITIDDEAAGLIAELSQGSMRDALSLLDQISNSTGNISKESVHAALGIADNAQIEHLIQATSNGDRREVLRIYDSVMDSGTAPGQLLDQLVGLLRKNLRSNDPSHTGLLHDLCTIPVQNAYLDVMIESVLLKHTDITGKPKKNTLNKPNSDDSEKPAKETSQTPPKKKHDSKMHGKAEPAGNDIVSAPQPLEQSAWVKTLSLIKAKDNALYALLRSTEQTFSEDKVVIKCRFQFHYRRMEQASNRQAVAAALKQTLGRPVKIELAAYTQEPKPEKTETGDSHDNIRAPSGVEQVLSIFGGEVV